MGIFNAIAEGSSRLRGCAWVVGAAWLVSVALALPLAIAVAGVLRSDLGNSPAADAMRTGYDDLWFQGFATRATGLATTFDAAVVGIGPVIRALDATVTATLLRAHPSIVAMGLTYLALWIVLTAGLVAASVPNPSSTFAAGAARYARRFTILTLAAITLHATVLLGIGSAFSTLVDEMTRETIDERVHFAWVAAKYVVLWLLVWCIGIVFDYAKILSVLDPGPLAQTLQRAARLVVGNGRAVFGLSATMVAIGVVATLCYWIIAPGAQQSSWIMVGVAFALSQAFVVVKIGLRCLLIASQTRLAAGIFTPR